ncbi:MAG: hypothetical protein D6706_07820 [Chloroflexi bacterium]|nr:MAG: hypothetical protein D6706_07820 [Chloroflexota bacterium]
MAIFADNEQRERPLTIRVGLLNGLLTGLAVAIGVWGLAIKAVAPLPLTLRFEPILLGSLFVVLLCGLTGWLTARINRSGWNMIFWLGTAVLVIHIIGYTPYTGRTLLIWLIDHRFWGIPIYTLPGINSLALLIGGIFLLLALTILGLFQEYRLDTIRQAMGEEWHITPGVLGRLLFPWPLIILTGFATNNIIGDTSWQAAQLVHQAIQVNLTYEGDLFAKARADGISYTALQGVRDQLTADYTLAIGEIDPATSTIFITADFDNGAWIYCRVLAGQLSFCFDASGPYTNGLHSLATGNALPETCRGCMPKNGEIWQAWFAERRTLLGDEPIIKRLGQWGSHVLMQVSAKTADFVVTCHFQGIVPVRLVSCNEGE